MTAEEFVKCFHDEKKLLLNMYRNEDTDVSRKIEMLGLSKEKLEHLFHVMDGVLTDAFYTVLLGLDGSASLGGKQVMYKVLDEDENELTGGDIEGHAWDFFHSEDE